MNVDHLTTNPEVRKAWACPDAELQSMTNILPRIPLTQREDYKECIRLHAEYIESGLVNIPWEYQEELQNFDPYLRLRYDLQCQCYVIERVDTGLRAWLRLFRWANEDGSAKSLSTIGVREIITRLRAADMQRIGPDEVLKRKRDRAAKIQQSNWNAGVEELRGAIDSMSNKQVDEFVAAEKAIAAGEKIHVRGQDAATMNMWYEMGRAGEQCALPSQVQAINPGHAPGQYIRQDS